MLYEENVISLRTAVIIDVAGLVSFMLTPCWLDGSVPGPRNYGKSDHTWLFRQKGSFWKSLGSGTIREEVWDV